MRNVIVEGRVIEDQWEWVAQGEQSVRDSSAPLVYAGDAATNLESLKARGLFGVWIDGADDVGLLTPLLAHVALIAVRFAAFTDGRGFSTAVLIRRLGWAGELRAIGDVLRDQLLQMQRVGFTSFAVREDRDAHDALNAFAEFSGAYQGNAIEPRPYFRRRDSESQSSV